MAVVVLSLVAAGGVAAQTTLWSATMTVGTTIIDGDEYTGYSGFTPGFGSLSDTDFRYGGAPYTVTHINESRGIVTLGISPALPEDAPLVLGIDNDSLALVDADSATLADTDDFGVLRSYVWYSTGMDWTEGETVRVRFTGTEPEEPEEPVPALPLLGAIALGAGLVAVGRRRLRTQWLLKK